MNPAGDAKAEGTSKARRYEFIDALRGWAILGVVAMHCGLWVTGPLGKLKGLFFSGGMGVELFFVASALTLCLSSRFHREPAPLRSFFVRRLFRIAPAYYLGILLYWFYDFATASLFSTPFERIGGVALNLTFLHGWSPQWNNDLVPGGWSIGAEMWFYLLFPALFAFCRSIKTTLLALPAAIALSVLAVPVACWIFSRSEDPRFVAFLSWWLPNQIQVFVCGILCFQVMQEFPLLPMSKNAQIVSIVALICTGISLAAAHYFSTHPAGTLATLFCGIAFAHLTIALWITPWRLFVNPILRWIGKISFSLYLVHWVAIPLLTPSVEKGVRLVAQHFAMQNDLVHVSCFLASLLAAIPLAWLSYRFIETPGIALGKRLNGYLDARLQILYGAGSEPVSS